jgi:hypothetical protein
MTSAVTVLEISKAPEGTAPRKRTLLVIRTRKFLLLRNRYKIPIERKG